MTGRWSPPCTGRSSPRCTTGRTLTCTTAGAGSRRSAKSSTRTSRSATAARWWHGFPGNGSLSATPTALTWHPARTMRSSSPSRSASTASTTTRKNGTCKWSGRGGIFAAEPRERDGREDHLDRDLEVLGDPQRQVQARAVLAPLQVPDRLVVHAECLG